MTRRYHNRRIGELLKELDFTEGRGTSIPKIRRILAANGSPEPIFHTDDERTSFYTEIKIHPEFLKPHVRGFRIEVAKIEACLTTFPAIKRAVVTVREDISESFNCRI